MSTTIFGWFLGQIFHPWLFMNHDETLSIFDAAEFVAALFDQKLRLKIAYKDSQIT
jgi:hypothetical protein